MSTRIAKILMIIFVVVLLILITPIFLKIIFHTGIYVGVFLRNICNFYLK